MLLSERQEPQRKRRRRRPSALPAPLLPSTPYEAHQVLDERTGCELVLWQAARDVNLWASLPVSRRGGLFHQRSKAAYEAGDVPVLAPALATFSLMVASPLAVDRKTLAAACTAVYDWARGQDFLATAAYFAELAAHVHPRIATLATAAGRASRHRAAFERAERWFDRAEMIARKTGDQTAYAEVLLTAGNMAFQRGQYARARALFDRAYTKGERYDLRDMAAAAKHNLMGLDFTLGNYEASNEHAMAAFALYGRGNDRVPYLAHDVAHLWISTQYYDLALKLLLACEPLIPRPGEQLKVWANIGNAAAGAGRADVFYEAWERVEKAALVSPSEHAPEALTAIAEGAYRLGRTAQAVEVAEHAVQLARQRSHKDAETSAVESLHRIRSGQRSPPLVPAPDVVRAFAARLLRALADPE